MSAPPAPKPADLSRRFLKPAVFVVSLLPAAWLAFRAATGNLGVNPIEDVTRTLGDWALRFLVIALAVTPLRMVTGWNAIGRLRRMMGLFAFFYVTMHMMAYIGLDQFFDWPAIWKDIVKRVYITIGMAGVLTMIPLAVTSTDAMVKRMGGRNWRRLHRIVYLSAVLGVIHYFFMIKAGYQQPLIYAGILFVLLAYRAAKRWP